VTFDPRSHKVEFDRASLRTERNASKHANDASFDSLASSPPASTTPSASEASDDANDSIEQARQIWRENLKQGYCTQEEFDKQMRDLDGS